MKVLGLSFGRKMQRCELLVKEALFAAKEAGADVRFLSTINLEISHCRGCGACGARKEKGGQVKCVLRDDYAVVEEAVLDADAIVLAAPVYAVGIVGQFKNFVDRFGAAHDRAALLEEQKKRLAEGKTGEELLDPRYFKDRYVGYISVGGASTHHWVSLGLPMLQLFGFSSHMKVLGQIDAYDQGRTGNPLLDRELTGRCAELGRGLAEAAGRPFEEVTEWFGEEGVCPVCHCRLLSVDRNRSARVECPICGIEGELKIRDGRLETEFSQEQIDRARWTLPGLYEHFHEIQGMLQVCMPRLEENREFLERELERYEQFDQLATW